MMKEDIFWVKMSTKISSLILVLILLGTAPDARTTASSNRCAQFAAPSGRVETCMPYGYISAKSIVVFVNHGFLNVNALPKKTSSFSRCNNTAA